MLEVLQYISDSKYTLEHWRSFAIQSAYLSYPQIIAWFAPNLNRLWKNSGVGLPQARRVLQGGLEGLPSKKTKRSRHWEQRPPEKPAAQRTLQRSSIQNLFFGYWKSKSYSSRDHGSRAFAIIYYMRNLIGSVDCCSSSIGTLGCSIID